MKSSSSGQKYYSAKKSFSSPKSSDSTKFTPSKCGVIYMGIDLPTSEVFRRQMVRLVESGNFSISRNMEITKMLEKETMSDSLQFFAELIHEKYKLVKQKETGALMIKLTFDVIAESGTVDDNGLVVERKIYFKVTNPLVFNRSTPHIIIAYADLRFELPAKILPGMHPFFKKDVSRINNTLSQLRKFNDNGMRYDTQNGHFLIMERSNGKQLGRLIREMSMDDLRIVLFQVIYTLICFKDVGLVHNDLHIGNLFLTHRLDASKPYYYWVGEYECYEIDSPLMIQIFDFDRSHKSKTDIEKCQIVNNYENNEYVEQIDIACFLFHVLFTQHDPPQEISKEITKFIESLDICDLEAIKSLYPPFVRFYGRLYTDDDPPRRYALKRAQLNSLHEMLGKVGEPFRTNLHISEGKDMCGATQMWVRPALRKDFKLDRCNKRSIISSRSASRSSNAVSSPIASRVTKRKRN